MKADERRLGATSAGEEAMAEDGRSEDGSAGGGGGEVLSGRPAERRDAEGTTRAVAAGAGGLRRAFGDVVAAAVGGGGGSGGGGGLTASKVLPLLAMIVASFLIPVSVAEVMCNEYQRCYTVQQKQNVSKAIEDNDRAVVCSVITTAIGCINEARQDCVITKNVPDIIFKGLDSFKSNLTLYTDNYCDSNGSDVSVGGHISLVTLLWSVLLSAWLSSCSL